MNPVESEGVHEEIQGCSFSFGKFGLLWCEVCFQENIMHFQNPCIIITCLNVLVTHVDQTMLCVRALRSKNVMFKEEIRAKNN